MQLLCECFHFNKRLSLKLIFDTSRHNQCDVASLIDLHFIAIFFPVSGVHFYAVIVILI